MGSEVGGKPGAWCLEANEVCVPEVDSDQIVTAQGGVIGPPQDMKIVKR